MTTVRLVDDSDSESVRVNFPYDPELVAMVKDLISPSLRSYDPPTKTWSVHGDVADRLADEMIKAGHTVVHGDEPPPPPKPEHYGPGVRGFFGIDDGEEVKVIAAALLAQVPPELQPKVFRAMARQLYPDLYSGRR